MPSALERVKSRVERLHVLENQVRTLPDDLQDDAQLAFRDWKTERATMQRNLDAARCQAAETGREEILIDKALAALANLPDLILTGEPATLAETLRGLITRIDLNFSHEKKASGRTFSVCTGGMIHFKPTVGGMVSVTFLRTRSGVPNHRTIAC